MLVHCCVQSEEPSIVIAIDSTRLVAALLFYYKKKINNEELFMNKISYVQIAFTIHQYKMLKKKIKQVLSQRLLLGTETVKCVGI